MIEPSQNAVEAVKEFEFLSDVELFSGQGNSTTMKLFMPKLNSRDFDNLAIEKALDSVVIDFALSRSTVQKYEQDKKWQQMSREAREKFRNPTTNKGELGELILYTFLEGHLKAPQILSKMSLKTTAGDYTKKSDGLHYVKVPNSERYHLIFGEAKMYVGLRSAFKKAFESISEHEEGKDFEKSLISSQISSEFVEEKDREFIEYLLYPQKNKERYSSKISDAFGIFIGFELNVPDENKTMSEDDFDDWIKDEIKQQVQKIVTKIEKYITDEWDWKDGPKENRKEHHKHSLIGKNFYVYLMPFSNLDETRKQITEGITK